MPGYEVTPVEALKSGLICCECRLLLRDAVQTEEGDRLCRTCYEEIKRTGTSKGGITLDGGECYPDRAVGKEVMQLLVKCWYHQSGCAWEGKLQDIEVHVQEECQYQPQQCSNDGCGALLPKLQIEHHMKNECRYRSVHCEYCGQATTYNCLETHYKSCTEYPITCDMCSNKVKKRLLDYHIDNHCPFVMCMCGQKIRRNSLQEHLSDASTYSSHMKSLFTIYSSVQKTQKSLQSSLKEAAEVQAKKNVSSGELKRVEADLSKSQKKFDGRVSLLEQKLIDIGHLQEGLESVRGESLKQKEANNAMIRRMDAQEEQLKGLQGQVVVYKGQQSSGVQRYTGQYSESYSDSRIIQLEKRVEDLERQNTMLKVHMSELELQLQASLASTHNGSFLWRIPDVARRRKDALEERITSIYSPPFYTGRNGYKMCVRAYLNGDGIGYRTHLSLFFVLMRGEYDPLLKWPFDCKVSLILVDQDHRKHIVQTFKPTPDSSSFKRPTSDMNVASGCPQFAKIAVLEDPGYVKDDIIYVKCIVDVSRIFHP